MVIFLSAIFPLGFSPIGASDTAAHAEASYGTPFPTALHSVYRWDIPDSPSILWPASQSGEG